MRGTNMIVVIVGLMVLADPASTPEHALSTAPSALLRPAADSATSARPVTGTHVPTETAPTVGEVTIAGSTTRDDRDAVRWARDQFAAADLPLPDLRVTFHPDTDRCEGALGGYAIDDGGHHVLVCVTGSGSARQLLMRRTLLHEFAHVWDHHALTDDTREAFMEFTGFEGWLSGVPYERRAGERAAEVITWGLMDRPFLMGSVAEPMTHGDLRDGYRILTGGEPPHGYVWSFFAAANDVYAHTPAQLETVREAWEQSEARGLIDDRVEIRFHRDTAPCGGRDLQSVREASGSLRIHVCPGDGDFRAELIEAFARPTR